MDMLAQVGLAPANLGDAPTVSTVGGNINEVLPFMIMSGVDDFVKDTPYELEFPAAPTSVSCRYAKGTSPTDVSLKSIKVQLDGAKATIKTSDMFQQMILLCEARYSAVISGEGTIKFGSQTAPFNVIVVDNPVMTEGSVKTKGSLALSGTATAVLSESAVLQVMLAANKGEIASGATCQLTVEGVKTDIPVKSQSSGASDIAVTAIFDLPEAAIVKDKKFSIECKKDAVKTEAIIKGYEPAILTAGVAVSNFTANSATSAGVVLVAVMSAASIISIFF